MHTVEEASSSLSSVMFVKACRTRAATGALALSRTDSLSPGIVARGLPLFCEQSSARACSARHWAHAPHARTGAGLVSGLSVETQEVVVGRGVEVGCRVVYTYLIIITAK